MRDCVVDVPTSVVFASGLTMEKPKSASSCTSMRTLAIPILSASPRSRLRCSKACRLGATVCFLFLATHSVFLRTIRCYIPESGLGVPWPPNSTPPRTEESALVPPPSLLNLKMIESELLAEAPWAESHGSDHHWFLGAGMLYYGFAYSFQAQTIVVLGSGGGFVPRVLKQAQRDLELAGRPGPFRLYLIDAHLAAAGWGSTFYAENGDTVMRRQYPDVHYIFDTTDRAFRTMVEKRVVASIDYLHIDADHSFEQSLQDFEHYVTLLSPRGVVSFHDTCFDARRKCRTGVPRTVAKIREQLDENGLQLLDAHYLYRGIAFAVRRDAPGLEAPPEKRRNFCRNNAHRLSKRSPGFTLNGRVGKLDSLGDFYECHRRFNMTELAGVCPFGTMRDSKGTCGTCVPGMTGDDCRSYLLQRMREQGRPSAAQQGRQQSHRLAAAWLAERQSQRVLELGVAFGASVSSGLLHPVLSVIVVDPWVESPVWTEDQVPSLRHLPCNPSEVLEGGVHHSALTFEIGRADAWVCLDCERSIGKASDLQEALQPLSQHRVSALVLEGSNSSSFLVEAVTACSGTKWSVEHDVLISDRQEHRRIVMLTKTDR